MDNGVMLGGEGVMRGLSGNGKIQKIIKNILSEKCKIYTIDAMTPRKPTCTQRRTEKQRLPTFCYGTDLW